MGLNQEFMADLFKLIHGAAIKRQERIMNTPNDKLNDITK